MKHSDHRDWFTRSCCRGLIGTFLNWRRRYRRHCVRLHLFPWHGYCVVVPRKAGRQHWLSSGYACFHSLYDANCLMAFSTLASYSAVLALKLVCDGQLSQSFDARSWWLHAFGTSFSSMWAWCSTDCSNCLFDCGTSAVIYSHSAQCLTAQQSTWYHLQAADPLHSTFSAR